MRLCPSRHPEIIGAPQAGYDCQTWYNQFHAYCRTQEWWWDLMVNVTLVNRSLLKWLISGRLLSRLRTVTPTNRGEFAQVARTYGENDPMEWAIQPVARRHELKVPFKVRSPPKQSIMGVRQCPKCGVPEYEHPKKKKS